MKLVSIFWWVYYLYDNLEQLNTTFILWLKSSNGRDVTNWAIKDVNSIVSGKN